MGVCTMLLVAFVPLCYGFVQFQPLAMRPALPLPQISPRRLAAPLSMNASPWRRMQTRLSLGRRATETVVMEDVAEDFDSLADMNPMPVHISSLKEKMLKVKSASLPSDPSSLAQHTYLDVFTHFEDDPMPVFVSEPHWDCRRIGELPSGLFRVLKHAAIPATAALGFALAPSPRLALKGLGALVSAPLGMFMRNYLVYKRKEAAAHVLSGIVASGAELSEDDIHQIGADYHLEDAEVSGLLQHVYAEALVEAIECYPQIRLDVIDQLTSLAERMNLQENELTNAVFKFTDAFATLLHIPSSNIAFAYYDEIDSLDNKFIENKPRKLAITQNIVYLAERLLKNAVSEEAFEKAFPRILERVRMSAAQASLLHESLTRPSYKTLLNTLSGDVTSFTSEQLLRARQSIGVTDTSAMEMHMDAIDEVVKDILSGPYPVIASVTSERLYTLKSVLGIGDVEFEKILESRTVPILQTHVSTVVDNMLSSIPSVTSDDVSRAWESLKTRQTQLKVTDASFTKICAEICGRVMAKEISKVELSVGSINDGTPLETALANLLELEAVHSKLNQLLSNLSEDDGKSLQMPTPKISVSGIVREGLARGVVAGIVSRKCISPDDARLLRLLNSVAGVLITTINGKLNDRLPPIVREAIEEFIREDKLDAADKEKLRKLCIDLNVGPDFVGPMVKRAYKQQVQKVANLHRYPPKQEKEHLQKVANFLELDNEVVSEIHVEVFGSAYVNAVNEAMGSTGVVTPEYLVQLKKLQSRLLISDADADDLFNKAVKERMKPMVTLLVDEYDSQTLSREELAKKKGMDMGGDPFLRPTGTLGISKSGVFMRESMNMVDFLRENGVKEVTPVWEDTFLPVNVSGMGLGEGVGEKLVKHFIFNTLIEDKPAVRERYMENTGFFALAMDVKAARLDALRREMVENMYEKLVQTVAMQRGGQLTPEDLGPVVAVQKALRMDQSEADAILLKAKLRVIRQQAEQLVKSSSTPAAAVSLRRLVEGLGLDVRESDVGFTEDFVSFGFAQEAECVIEADRNVQEGLIEAAQAWGMDEDRAGAIVSAVVKAKLQEYLTRACEEAKRGAQVEPFVDAALRFGKLMPEEIPLVPGDRLGGVSGQDKGLLLRTYMGVLFGVFGDMSHPKVTQEARDKYALLCVLLGREDEANEVYAITQTVEASKITGPEISHTQHSHMHTHAQHLHPTAEAHTSTEEARAHELKSPTTPIETTDPLGSMLLGGYAKKPLPHNHNSSEVGVSP